MVTKKSFAFVHTDKDTHFTDALVQNASEYEDISLGINGRGEAPCQIESIRLLSQQNLSWMVSFHRTDNTAPGADSITDFDKNTMIDFWQWETTEGFAMGTAFVYAVSGLNIPYRDEDGTGELHVALHNRSATAKTASSGGVGHVQMTFGISGAA